MTQAPSRLTCQTCGNEFTWESQVVGNRVEELFVVCEPCGERNHAYFETPDITAARIRLVAAMERFQAEKSEKRWKQYQTQQAAYKRVFDADQIRWRRKRNIPERAKA